MNQIYVDINDEKKDQIQNDNIQLEISESYDIKITENTQEHQNIVQIASETQFKNKQCDFCNNIGHLKKKKTIKKSYFLCQNCSQFIRSYDQNLMRRNDKNITIEVPQGLMPYDLKRGECRNCYRQNQILYMIGECSHYICHICLVVLIWSQVSGKKYKINCPICDSLMDDYFLLYFFYILYDTNKTDYLIKPKMRCINKNCKLTIKSIPYMQIEATSFKIDNDKAICYSCNKQFCALCWNSHKGGCNYEKSFKDSFKKLGIVRCPRCQSLGQREPCEDYIENGEEYSCWDLFCPLCGYRFCLSCLGPVQIYDSVKNKSGYTCYKCKRNFNYIINNILRIISRMREQRRQRIKTMNLIQKIRQLFLDIFFISIVVLVLIIYLGVVLIFFSFQHGKNVVKNVCVTHMRYYQKITTGFKEAFLPVLLFCLLVQVIISYIITFIPAFIFHLKNMIY